MFMSDISIIVRKMRLVAESSLTEHGIGFPEQLVIMHLAANGPSNQAAIAEKLEIDKGAVTKTVNKLESTGLVTRAENPANRREKRVELAPAADAILQSMHAAYQDLEGRMFAGLSDKEIATTCRALEVIAGNLVKADEGDL